LDESSRVYSNVLTHVKSEAALFLSKFQAPDGIKKIPIILKELLSSFEKNLALLTSIIVVNRMKIEFKAFNSLDV